jgi:hypothetical protein
MHIDTMEVYPILSSWTALCSPVNTGMSAQVLKGMLHDMEHLAALPALGTTVQL